MRNAFGYVAVAPATPRIGNVTTGLPLSHDTDVIALLGREDAARTLVAVSCNSSHHDT
jgi:hypothetical protein